MARWRRRRYGRRLRQWSPSRARAGRGILLRLLTLAARHRRSNEQLEKARRRQELQRQSMRGLHLGLEKDGGHRRLMRAQVDEFHMVALPSVVPAFFSLHY